MLTVEVKINERRIWRANAHNDGTGDDTTGNYDCGLHWFSPNHFEGRFPHIVQTWRIEGFDRRRGAIALARMLLERVKGDTDGTK